jgi:hypothetical protein
MRYCLAGMLALVAVSLSGCFTAPPDHVLHHYDTRVPFSCLTGEDVVQLDIYLVERPAGDHCIDREIWELTDEQVLGERKPLLEENGFRAGVLGDSPPDGLRTLLQSERSCANPRRLRLRVGKPATLVLGPASAQLQFSLRQEGRTADVDFEQAQCVLEATTVVADDGRMALHFTPMVRHGQLAATPRPVQNPSGTLRWEVQTNQPTEAYHALSWDMTVAPNTYIAIGALVEAPDTLGQAAFLSAGPPHMQRLLVLRPSRAMAERGPAAPTDGKSPPLAVQAGAASAYGTTP